MCGADLLTFGGFSVGSGSPPRVRSRHKVVSYLLDGSGITSACAEQTKTLDFEYNPLEDHLRVCGADKGNDGNTHKMSGSPPRVRSRRVEGDHREPQTGITSACAEQTGTPPTTTCAAWDHLRVCGADLYAIIPTPPVMGSPPRVRSRRVSNHASCRCGGDHLRVCGADCGLSYPPHPMGGSPPRVRSRLDGDCLTGSVVGITSACAEQTR